MKLWFTNKRGKVVLNEKSISILLRGIIQQAAKKKQVRCLSNFDYNNIVGLIFKNTQLTNLYTSPDTPGHINLSVIQVKVLFAPK